MKLKLCTIILALAAFAASARAQLTWHVIHTDEDSQTQFYFGSISCSGNNCTVGAVLTDLATAQQTPVLYETSDGGVTWIMQIPDVKYPFTFGNAGFTKIQRIDSLNIVAIGDSGLIIRSFNGGSTWERQSSPTHNFLEDVHFSDSLIGIVAAASPDSNILITSDGGRHWNIASFGGAYLWQCHSYGNGKFRLFKYDNGQIYTTLDNFKTIDITKPVFDSLSDPRHNILIGCTFGGGDTVLAFGEHLRDDTIRQFGGYELIMRSIDGGVHWEKPFIFFSGVFGDVRYTTSMDRDTVIAIGEEYNKFFLSTDRGASWNMDTLILDTNYNQRRSFGLSMTGDGHPLAILTSSPGQAGQAILVRGSWEKLNVFDMIAYKTRIYPNPASETVTIVSVDVSRPLHIIDLLGREVTHGILSEQGKFTVDVSKLLPGIYEVLLDDLGRRFAVGKVVVIAR